MRGNQVIIERVSGDKLRVRFSRDSLVFSPGESFEFEVVPSWTGLEDVSNFALPHRDLSAR